MKKNPKLLKKRSMKARARSREAAAKRAHHASLKEAVVKAAVRYVSRSGFYSDLSGAVFALNTFEGA